MGFSKKRLYLVLILLVFVIGGAIYVSLRNSQKNQQNNANSSNTSNTYGPPPQNSNGGKTPPQAVLTVVDSYVQAREDSVGSDQSSPTSWTNQVKSITTPSWYAQLQNTSTQTGTAGGNYIAAHNNNYIVRANVYDCVWKGGHESYGQTDQVVVCSLTDNTVSASSQTVVDPSNLPFGWTHSGQQIPPTLALVQQNNQWLVDGDESGQGT